MKSRMRNTISSLLMTILLLASLAHAQAPAAKHQANQPAPQASNSTVTGSGTIGRLSKWAGVSGISTYVIDDSTIFENKNGLVGIGTDTPTSRLTVQGMIETTLGGYKFPDGTVQTTAATSGLQSVFHDATLTGNGTQGSPLGISLPLILSGSAKINGLVQVKNNAEGGTGVYGVGGSSTTNSPGGIGSFGQGGLSSAGFGGVGLWGQGGSGDAGGGDGAFALGGDAGNGPAGTGLRARGGSTFATTGGTGIFAEGGSAAFLGAGGDGLVASKGSGSPDGRAGVFNGDVMIDGDLNVTGNVSKGGGSFKIDHPLDPENKYLYHSFVESPDMMNIYNGNVTTDGDGDAVVELPEYFEALNRDCRYQLTVIGTFAQAIVMEKIKGNHFRIKTNAPNVEVSWQVTGIRQDAYANRHRIQVEVNKTEQERGFYLYPELFNQPEERGVEWARHPQLMQQLKQQRLAAEQQRKRRNRDDR